MEFSTVFATVICQPQRTTTASLPSLLAPPAVGNTLPRFDNSKTKSVDLLAFLGYTFSFFCMSRNVFASFVTDICNFETRSPTPSCGRGSFQHLKLRLWLQESPSVCQAIKSCCLLIFITLKFHFKMQNKLKVKRQTTSRRNICHILLLPAFCFVF